MDDINEIKTRDNQERRPTMIDVAKRANVSISTVSHVINGTAPISTKVQQKVYKAINELDYKPNALARGLRQKNTKVIGLVVPDIQNEFYAGCASGVLQAADNEQYTVLLSDCCYDLGREERSINALIERRVDGLIFFGGAGDDYLINASQKANIPVVLGDRSLDGFNSVEFTNVNIMRQMVKMLYDMGKRRFCFVSEPIEMINLQQRRDGFLLGLIDCGIEPDQQTVLIDKRMQQEKVVTSRKVVQEYLMEGKCLIPDVILTSCDAIAIGTINALKEQGFRVPQDVGVVGFDNIAMAPYTLPPLTTVSQDMHQMGNQTFLTLLGMINNKDQKPVHIMLEPEIIMRGSV